MQLVAPLRAGWGFDGVTNFLRPLQLHRIGPAVGFVHQVAQAIEGVLIAWRRNVQAAARSQLKARGAKMQFNAILVIVADPEHVVLLPVQPSESQLFKGIHDLGLLRLVRRVLSSKTDHACAVGPLMSAGINQRLCAAWIATQHIWRRFSSRGWGSKGRLAAHRMAPWKKRQRMTWVALLFPYRSV